MMEWPGLSSVSVLYLWWRMYVMMMVKRQRSRTAVQVYTTGWRTSTGTRERPGKSSTS